MIKNIIIGSGIAVIVVLGVLSLKAPSVVTNTVYKDAPIGAVQSSPAPIVNVPAPVVNVAAPKVSVNVPEQKLGALSSPDLPYPYFSFGGARQWASSATFAYTAGNGTTTPCKFTSPAATSTLAYVGWSITTATSSATTWTVATSTVNAYATTTLVQTVPVGAGLTKETGWYPSTVAGGNAPMYPSTFVVIGVAGGTASGGTVVSGKCSAIWNEI